MSNAEPKYPTLSECPADILSAARSMNLVNGMRAAVGVLYRVGTDHGTWCGKAQHASDAGIERFGSGARFRRVAWVDEIPATEVST